MGIDGGVSKISVFQNTTGFKSERERRRHHHGKRRRRKRRDVHGAERPTAAAAANDDDAERPRDFDEYDDIEKTDGCRERVRRVDVVAQQRDAEKKRRGRSIGREGNDGRLRSERKFALVDARSAIGRVVSRSESAMEPGG